MALATVAKNVVWFTGTKMSCALADVLAEDIGTFKNADDVDTRYVRAFGKDNYQWAPEHTKRFTQCIHQAATRLQFPAPNRQQAATFQIIATEAIIDTSTAKEAYFSAIPRKAMFRDARPKEKSIPMCR